jgi:ketosteroid isomerase-like protein
MSEENIRKAESYYQAINNKDLAAAAQYLHPDVRVLSPMMEIEGKEVVLDGVQRFMAMISTLTIRERFSSGDKVVLIYDIDSPAPVGTLRASALITFKDNLIIRIELFFDARPFEK